MSEQEALMWNMEKDPWLSSNIGAVVLFDSELDWPRFRRIMARGAATIPELRRRPVADLGRLAPPVWETDPEFDLDAHVRHAALPPTDDAADLRPLLDFATEVVSDPFDRTRPLWRVYAVDGIAGGRSALVTKMHHTIADGEGALRLAMSYMSFSPDAPDPEGPSLASVLASEIAPPRTVLQSARSAVAHLVRRERNRFLSTLASTADHVRHPSRLPDLAQGLVDSLSELRDATSATTGGPAGAWQRRSRNRHLEVLEIPFRASKQAARGLGGTLNDFFVTGSVDAASGYCRAHGEDPAKFTVTFAVNTRREPESPARNAFTVDIVELPAGRDGDRLRLFKVIHGRLAEERSRVHGPGLMAEVSGLVNLLPTSLVTRLARARAEGIDFATSNVPASPVPVYVAGSRVSAIYPIGPLAGTAFNITMLSYDGALFFGINADPAAVEDPRLLRDCLADAFRKLLEATPGGAVPHRGAPSA